MYFVLTYITEGHVIKVIQVYYNHSIQQETQFSPGYTHPTDSVTVEVDGPAPVQANGCLNLSWSNMSCTFNITDVGTYTVILNTTNAVGTTSTMMTWNCKWKC